MALGRALDSFDLNLLMQLHLLLDEASVTRAANRAGVTQSAMSRSLGKLREALGDDLLVQVGRGMELTARAEALRDPLRAILRDIEARVLSPTEFEPATAELELRIAAIDFAEVLLVGPLLAELRREAPGITVTLTGTHEAFRGGLGRGELDLVIGVVSGDRASLKSRRLLRDDFVCVMRPEHPLADESSLTLEDYVAHEHLLVSLSGHGRGQVDEALAQLDRDRRVAARVRSFLVGLRLVRSTDLLLTCPRSVVRLDGDGAALVVREPPLALPSLTLSMLWHASRHSDPALAWLRARLVEKASGV